MLSRIIAVAAILAAGFIALSADVQAVDTSLKPYVLASSGTGTITSKLPEVKAALIQQGFTIAGEYSPYKGAYVVAVTNEFSGTMLPKLNWALMELSKGFRLRRHRQGSRSPIQIL